MTVVHAGATPSRDFTKPAPPLRELSLRTKLWLIGVSITGKAVDYDACPDGPEVGRSLLAGVLLGGGKKRKKTEYCSKCEQWWTKQGFPSHRCVGGRPDPTLAPRGFTNDPKCCPICTKLSGGAKKKDGYGTCSFWGKSGHLGSEDVDQVRAAKLEKSEAGHGARKEYIAQEKQQGLCGHKVTEERIDWSSSAYGDPSKSKLEALKDFIDATPDWRNDATFLQRLAEHLFDLDFVSAAVEERLAGPRGLVYHRCNYEDRYEEDVLPRKDGSSTLYPHLVEVVDTLLKKGADGELALLKLLVSSKLLAALGPLMSDDMRRMFPDNRTNACGASCSSKLSNKMKPDCEGPLRLRLLVLKLAGLQFEGGDGGAGSDFAHFWQCYGGFGLRTSKADLVRLTERLAYVCQMLTPEEGSRPGCDFGTLYALAQLFQGFAVKEEGDALAGDKWHRKENRDQSASMKEVVDYLRGRVTAGLSISSTFDLEVMLDLGRVVLFKNLDVSNLQDSFATVFQFFTETYDAARAKHKTAQAYRLRAREAVHGRSAKEGCWEGIPTALDGFDLAYRIGGRVFGHDVFGEDPRDAKSIAALARNLERICAGVPWHPSYITTQAWGGDSELREQLLTKLMPLADRASKIYHTIFWPRIVDAGDDIEAVLEAVREAWHEFSSFMENDYCRDGWLEDVEALFRKQHVPRLLAELAQPRQVLVKTHDLSKGNWREPVESTYAYADRPGYEFGGYPSFMREKARTTPFDWPALSALNTSNADASDGAGGTLKPLNSPTHEAKRRRV